MDGRHRGASRGTELGLQAASLAPHLIPRTNQPLVGLPAEGLRSVLHRFGAFGTRLISATAPGFAGPSGEDPPYETRSLPSARNASIDEGMKE